MIMQSLGSNGCLSLIYSLIAQHFTAGTETKKTLCTNIAFFGTMVERGIHTMVDVG